MASTLNAHTLEGWISAFRSQLNVVSDFLQMVAISDGRSATFFADETVLSKYHAELQRHIKAVDLTQREREFYAYNPRLFAYDMYGAPEFWYLILYANELHSALDFSPSRVKFFEPSVVQTLNEIRILEKDRLDDNQQHMTDIIVGNLSENADILVDLL